MGLLFPQVDCQFLEGKFYSFSILSTDHQTFIILTYSNHLVRVINDQYFNALKLLRYFSKYINLF